MANEPTADTGLLPRTYFRAPRVPLDLRALFLALVGYAVYRFGAWGLEKLWDGHDVVGAFFDRVMGLIAVPTVRQELGTFVAGVFAPDGMVRGTFWQELAGGAWVFLVWGFFGQAIHRITALRIARDEGLSVRDALSFAARNYWTVLLCPVIVAAAIGLFYGCNALAGVVMSIPILGGVLGLVLLPLATISTLLILLIAIGGAIGMPLVAAAAAWERNGSLDAISRAFSYIFARPLQFFWNYFLVLVFAAVILVVGGYFSDILTGSIDAGTWSERTSVLIDPPTDPETTSKLDKQTLEMLGDLEKKTEGKILRPPARSFHAVEVAPWSDKIQVFLFWILLNLVHYGFVAAALWWFLGATTSTYADLRADVDGTEEDEIYLEDEEEDFAELSKAPAPPPPPPAAPPPPSTPPVNPPPA